MARGNLMSNLIFLVALLSAFEFFPTCFAQADDLCCPPVGPSGNYIQLQQSSPSRFLCDYGIGPTFIQCPYDGYGALIENNSGCPPTLRPDPLEPFCPFTNPIHPQDHRSKCVDVGKDFKVGSEVKIDDCDGSSRQRFVYKQGVTFIRVAGTNFCLWAGPTPQDGSKVVLATCNENEILQRWDYGGGNQFGLDGTGLALDLPGGNLADGNLLDVKPFMDTAPNEHWTSY